MTTEKKNTATTVKTSQLLLEGIKGFATRQTIFKGNNTKSKGGLR